jgi:hypothetical protein
MLNKKVSASLQFDELPDDTCRLLATWTGTGILMVDQIEKVW